MWTSGFFNSVNGDRKYNAQQMSEIFDGLITNGVYASVGNKLAVQPNSGMTVQIATGRGWFGGHWVNNSAEYLLDLEDSDVTLNRYCAVCVRVDEATSGRNAEPYIKYGDFATSPIKPAMERTDLVKEYCLAYVYIAAGASNITAANIEDTRGNNDLCGWVTGLIEQVDTTTLWQQYSAEWDEFMAAYVGDANAWMAAEKAAFIEWYDNLQATLSGDVAANLANDVTQLKGQFTKLTGVFDGLGWSSQGDGTYTQTVTVNGVAADDDIMIKPAAAYKDTYVAMGCEAISQAVNSITFSCHSPEDVNLQIEVIVVNI